jgi:hypothetical protein
VAQTDLFTEQQVKYMTSEGCGLKGQGYFQEATSSKATGQARFCNYNIATYRK